MINNYVLETLKQNNVNDARSFENVLRELAQKMLLYALSRTSFFKKAVFYGGTCLRIFHNIQRFSEDLDFTVLEENIDFSWDDYMPACIRTLESYGFEVEIGSKPEYDIGEIRRRYVKIPCYDIAKEYFGREVFHKDKKLSIKMEISTWFVEGAQCSLETIYAPMISSVLCYDMSTLFAGKLAAVMNRSWRSRVKGRDFYDYIFYITLGTKYNFEYLKNKCASSLEVDPKEITEERIKATLLERFESIDYKQVMADIAPFVDANDKIGEITKDILIPTIKILSHN